MDLPTPNPNPPVMAEPPVPPAENSRSWLRWLIIGLGAIIIIGALVFGGLALHKSSNKVTSGKTQSTQVQDRSTTDNSPQASNQNSSKTEAATGSQNSGASSSPANNAAASNSNRLANTGPGQMVGIFAGAVLTGVAFYELRLRRRLN